jgi:hypothetical protein
VAARTKKRKKTTRPRSAKRAAPPRAKAAAARPTRCEEGDGELSPFELPAHIGDPVRFTMFVCKANARVRLWIETLPLGESTLLADQTGASEISLPLPALPAGRYLLRWSAITPSSDWQTRTELFIRDVVRFRRRKKAEGDNPVNMGVLVLEVS